MTLPAWVPANETKPAPMPLLVVQSFVNTREADTETDLLLDDEVIARAWLNDAGLVDPGVPEIDLAETRALRESVRALLVHNGGGPSPTASGLGPMERIARRCRFRPGVVATGRVELNPAADPALAPAARLLLIIRDAQRDGTWKRLKACRNDECQWAFYDRSHAARGAWCDMAVCGNRMKNRNLRSRRAGAGRDTSRG
jgi:predicted RNA-binding Zn ribbon-like protein